MMQKASSIIRTCFFYGIGNCESTVVEIFGGVNVHIFALVFMYKFIYDEYVT